VSPLLDVRNLKTHFRTSDGVVKAVDGVSFTVDPQETLGLIGESGCGKSVTAHSIMRIVPRPGQIEGGEIHMELEGETVDLADPGLSGSELRAIRGRDISMVFQEPMTSLSPVHSIGNQIRETLFLHRTRDRKEANEIAVDMLARVGIANPQQRINEYPHQLSGGMRQRVMIAMALVCSPALLIADEPTTALDVTTQAQIMSLLQELQADFGMGVMLITHDLGVVAEMADDVVVMYLGQVAEYGDVDRIFHAPAHPYTKALLRSIPNLDFDQDIRLDSIRGMVPDPFHRPAGCPFGPRCDEVIEGRCEAENPPAFSLGEGGSVRCLHYEEVILS
jgi:peptide/nickel transport system ATP-binding protein